MGIVKRIEPPQRVATNDVKITSDGTDTVIVVISKRILKQEMYFRGVR